MNNKFLLFLILLAAVAFFLMDVYRYYPQLPRRVASHFSADGHANGWSDKNSFFIVWGAVFLGLSGLLALLIAFLEKIPLRWINLPNKEYWLAPERAGKTFALVRKYFGVLNLATVLFLATLFHLTLEANLLPEPVLGSEFWLIFILYFLGMIALSLYFITYFNRIPEDF